MLQRGIEPGPAAWKVASFTTSPLQLHSQTYFFHIAHRNLLVAAFRILSEILTEVRGAMLQYLTWAGISDADQDNFWTDPTAKQMVKNHYRALLYRTNFFTGKQWKDDPTIFAFNLYNVSHSTSVCSSLGHGRCVFAARSQAPRGGRGRERWQCFVLTSQ